MIYLLISVLMLWFQRLYIILFDGKWLYRLNTNIRSIQSGYCINIGKYSVTAIESLHDVRENSLIYVISYNNKNILYGTDLLRFPTRARNIKNHSGLIRLYLIKLTAMDIIQDNSGGHPDAGQLPDIMTKMN